MTGILSVATIAFLLVLFSENGRGKSMGHSNSFYLDRIIGGNGASPGQFPHLVSIQKKRLKASNELNQSWLPFCGGTILDERTILTAAHCFQETPESCTSADSKCYIIVAGEYKITENEPWEQIVYFSQSDYIIHDGYDGFHNDNDIAIIRLPKPLNFTSYVNSIELVNPHKPYRKTNAVIAGWGWEDSRTYSPADTLKQALVNIYTDEECAKQWGDDYHPEDMICAGPDRSKYSNDESVPVADSCYGDSGGPLIVQGFKNRSTGTVKKYIVGIVSWGFDCGYLEYPGLYTKVETYLPWIKKMMLYRRLG